MEMPAKGVYLVDKGDFDEAFESPGLFHNWAGSISLGSSAFIGTQNSTDLSGEVNLERIVPGVPWRTRSNRTSIDFTTSYSWSRNRHAGSENEKVKTFLYSASAEHDRYLNEHAFAFAQMIYTHNLAQDLELQQSYLGGIGVVAAKGPRYEFDLKGSLGYIQRGYYTSSFNVDVLGSTFGEELDYRGRRARFREELSGTPAWNGASKWGAGGKTVLSVPFTDALSVELTAIDFYLHGAPLGYKRNSFQVSFGLSYTLP